MSFAYICVAIVIVIICLLVNWFITSLSNYGDYGYILAIFTDCFLLGIGITYLLVAYGVI